MATAQTHSVDVDTRDGLVIADTRDILRAIDARDNIAIIG